MNSPSFIKPSDVQKELDRLEETHKENEQNKACLFNLIVYGFESERLPYFQHLVDQIASQFPCRILFIQEQKDENFKEMKAQVSAKVLESGSNKAIVYEQITLQTPKNKSKQIYSFILPHIVPDLPTYLIWTDDPTLNHPSFTPLKKLADRLIFDSQCSPSLEQFAQKIQSELLNSEIETIDLNWLRLDSWRKVMRNIFGTHKQVEELRNATQLKLTYLPQCNLCYCKNPFQVHYFHCWIASVLGLNPKKVEQKQDELLIEYQNEKQSLQVSISQEKNQCDHEQSSLSSVELKLASKKRFYCHTHKAKATIQVEICNDEKNCEVYNTFSTNPKWEQSLAREMCFHETSQHYISMLNTLSQIKGLT